MSRTRIICPGCGFVQTYCQCEASNEQNVNNEERLKAHTPHSFVQSAQDHGDIHSDRPLVGDTISWEEMQRASKLMEEHDIK